MSELGTDLVGASGDQLTFHKGKSFGGGNDLVIGLAGLGTGLRGVGDKNPVFLGILEKISLQGAFLGFRAALHNGKIPLVHFPVLNLLVDDPEGLGGFCGDDDAAGIPVDPVAQGGGEGVFLPGPPFPLLIKIGLDMVDEGFAVFRAVVGVDGQSGPLVYKKNVVVFIDDIQLGIGNGQIGIVLPGLIEELVVDIKLQQVALFQPGIPLHTLAVQLDPLDADILLRQGGRQQGNGLCQETVQPLTGIIGTDGKFFHYIFPIFSSKWRLICSVNSRAAL